jgi:hypothetical protein
MSRLADWLDPQASGVMNVDGSDPGQPQVPVYDFRMGNFDVIEGNAVHTTMVVEVLRSGDISRAEDVTIALSGQTAVVGEDYTAGPVIITFAADQTVAPVPLEIIGDAEPEPDETLQLSFAGFSTTGVAGITQPQTILTLINDDVVADDAIFSDQFED